MILFDDLETIVGSVQKDALAYVNNCNIDDTRTKMSGEVTLSLQKFEPNYSSYTSPIVFNDVPYDEESPESPAAQFYTYLMSLPRFTGGTQYPPAD